MRELLGRAVATRAVAASTGENRAMLSSVVSNEDNVESAAQALITVADAASIARG